MLEQTDGLHDLRGHLLPRFLLHLCSWLLVLHPQDGFGYEIGYGLEDGFGNGSGPESWGHGWLEIAVQVHYHCLEGGHRCLRWLCPKLQLSSYRGVRQWNPEPERPERCRRLGCFGHSAGGENERA